MSKKRVLRNTEAVAQMLAGEHKTQTKTLIGFSDAEFQGQKQKNREDGEIWEEKDATGKTICWWEIDNGIKIKYNVHPDVAKSMQKIREYLRSFPNCPKETCTCKVPKAIDEKFKKLTGMCEDCTISYETSLKIKGQFNQYALDKMKRNAEGYLKDAEVEIEKIKNALRNTDFLNSEKGDIETWTHEGLEEYLQKVDGYFEQYKSELMEKFQGQ